MKKLFLLYFLLIFNIGFAQKKQDKSILFQCDAILTATDIDNSLNADNASKIILKCSPKGKGQYNEAGSGRSRDKNYFKEEHNIAWIKFTATTTGNLIFKIKPRAVTDDYDFLLFKIEDNTSISKIKNKSLKPIRTNISRTDTLQGGMTGLNNSANSTHIISGVHNNFSKAIDVKKGEKYYLVLDNVYPEGEGAIVYLSYKKITQQNNDRDISGYVKQFKGFVFDDTDSLDAVISWIDKASGGIIETTRSNPKTGFYKFDAPYNNNNPNKKYTLNITSEKHFFKEISFKVSELPTPIHEKQKKLDIKLEKLKEGKKFPIHNINFVGGSTSILPSGNPSLKSLFKLMKENKSLQIMIEGHTNGCAGGKPLNQQLSVGRAEAVKSYLVKNGIDKKRIETIGYNCSQMIYPNPKTSEEHSLNRRVEILVTTY